MSKPALRASEEHKHGGNQGVEKDHGALGPVESQSLGGCRSHDAL